MITLLLFLNAAPPARLTPGQADLLRQREEAVARANDDWADGRRAEALAGLERAQALDARLFGPWHHATASNAHRLGCLYLSAGDTARADAHLRASAVGIARLHGEGHWRTAEARWAIEEARAEARRTPSQREAAARARALAERADDLLRKGQASPALAAAKEASALYEKALGPKHHSTVHALMAVASAHRALGEYRAALPLVERAVAVRRETHGEGHPETINALNNLAVLHRYLGDVRACVPLLRRALAATREARGERHPEYATSLGNLAAAIKEAGDPRTALPLLRRALALTGELSGTRSASYASSLNNLAVTLREMGEHKEALPLLEEALAIVRRVQGVRHPAHASALFSLAQLHQDAGDHTAALPLLEKALAVAGDALGKKHPTYATTLQGMAALRQARGDFEAALRLRERAVDLFRATLGERHPTYATAVDGLAGLHREMGDHRRALALYREALGLQKAASGERSPAYASALNNLAGLHEDMGDHAEALSLYRRSLALLAETLGERHPRYAATLNNIAGVHRSLGDVRAALPLFRRAAALTADVRGEGHPDHAAALNNLATLHHDMGDHRSSLPLWEKALAIRGRALGERHPSYAATLHNLSAAHKGLGDLKMARGLLERALALRKETLGEKHPHYATTLNNLAVLAREGGDLESSIPMLRRALAIRREALGERHPEYATALNNLANHLQDAGRHAAALPLLQRAAELRRETLGGQHPLYADVLGNLGAAYHLRGRAGAALLLQEQASALARRRLALDASVQSERLQMLAAATARYHLNARLSLPDDAAHSGHGHVLAWKGSAFAAQQARRRFVRAEADPETRGAARELLDATRSLALVARRDDAASLARAAALTARKEELESRLAERSADFRLTTRPPSGEAFRSTLPAGAALVDLLVHTGHDPARPRAGQTPGRRLVAWVARADAPTARVELGPMAPIEADIAAWRRSLEAAEPASPAGTRLRERVWTPLEKHLAGAKVVLISPDGATGRMPFAALPGRDGRALLEDVPLAIIPSPQSLPGLLRPVKASPSLLAVGGVDFGAGAAWPALAATSGEADAVAARFRAAFTGAVSSLTGAKATKAALREALPGRRHAHLATHGYFAPPSRKSALHGPFTLDGVAGWAPGLLSGVVLAGANSPTVDDDGVLTALEVAEMDLSGMELAVLSACQTGLGEEAAGEGMLGLQRAFAVAGCRSVVSSLWSVDDAATSVLMERFYLHLWEKKLPKLAALRQAQIDVLRHPEWVEGRARRLAGTAGLRGVGKASERLAGGRAERRSPPAWWAAWQLSGDWR